MLSAVWRREFFSRRPSAGSDISAGWFSTGALSDGAETDEDAFAATAAIRLN
jgi:hypothetical protein